MVRMPDSPAVSFAQLSVLPAPSEVTTPMPVTTTIGLPNLSRGAVMFSPSVEPAPCSLDRLDQGHAFAPPVAGPDHDNLGRRLRTFQSPARSDRSAETARRARSKAPPAPSPSGNCVSMVWPNSGAGGPHREIRMLAQERPFLRRDRLGAGRAGDDGAVALELAELRPQRFQRSPSPRRAACAAPGRRPRWSAAHRAWRRALPHAPWIR